MSGISKSFKLAPGVDEESLWKSFAQPLLAGAKPNIQAICHYGFTEMVNNVIDHSGALSVVVALETRQGVLRLMVSDEGIGVFRKIKEASGLATEHDAALELAKGKITTDPERHTGEGIFFTARMFDSFFLSSGSVYFHFHGGVDWMAEGLTPPVKGTMVSMEIQEDSSRTTREVFDRFAHGEGDFRFDRTVLAVRMFGEQSGHLVSRSQAKRLLGRLEQFTTVILDFEGVNEIGPAFADEIFRVFARTHPSIRVIPVNANDNVNRMILRTLTNGEGPSRNG
jgi:anti-sigma regulatory factor (Ser/Thr protein kinase)